MRTPLARISALAWEHPDDRAALEKLRGIPGFDGVVRQVASAYGGRGVRNLFLGNAVRVGPAQRPATATRWTSTPSWSRRRPPTRAARGGTRS